MEPRLRAALEGVAVFLFGILPGFFVVFNMVFSDAFGLADHALGVGYALVAYLVLGFLAGILTRTDVRWQAALLAAPGVLLLVWYTTKEPGDLLYHLLILVATLAGAVGGVLGGRRFQRPHGGTKATT